MAETAAIRALGPLDGRYHGGAGIRLAPAARRGLVVLQLSDAARSGVGAALGLALPTRPKTTVSGTGLDALWIGPDELLLVHDGEGDDLVRRIDAAGQEEQSAVAVSDRFVGIAVEGPAAEAVLAVGCPQDLREGRFPVGAASRTVLAKAEVILWRRGPDRFQLFCGRSFADYVWEFLVEASRSPAV